VNRDTKEECVAPCRVTGYHAGVHDKGKPAARRGRKAHGPPARQGRRPGHRTEETALLERTLAPALIAAELLCTLLWALTGAFSWGAWALALGIGAVLAVFLPKRHPPRGGEARGGHLPPPHGRAAGRA
jgi:hypothetical protein